MEARVVLETVLELVPPGGMSLADGYEHALVPMFLEYGPERLDVSIRR